MRLIYFYRGPFWLQYVVGALLVVAIVVAVVAITRSSRRHAITPRPWQGQWHPQWQGPWSPGLHELDVRYARGEIGREDYLQRRADILGQPNDTSGGTPPTSTGSAGSA